MKFDEKVSVEEQITHYLNNEMDDDSRKKIEEIIASDRSLELETSSSKKIIDTLKNNKSLIFEGMPSGLGQSRRDAILANCDKSASKPVTSIFKNFKFTLLTAAAAIFLLFNTNLFKSEAVPPATKSVDIDEVRGWFSFPIAMPSGNYTFSAKDKVLSLDKFVSSQDDSMDYLKESGIQIGDRVLKINNQFFGNLSKSDYERKFREFLNEENVTVYLQRGGIDVVPVVQTKK